MDKVSSRQQSGGWERIKQYLDTCVIKRVCLVLLCWWLKEKTRCSCWSFGESRVFWLTETRRYSCPNRDAQEDELSVPDLPFQRLILIELKNATWLFAVKVWHYLIQYYHFRSKTGGYMQGKSQPIAQPLCFSSKTNPKAKKHEHLNNDISIRWWEDEVFLPCIQDILCFYTRIIRKPVWLMQSLPKPLPVMKIQGYYFCLKMGLTEETGIHLLVQGLLSLNQELNNWFF